MRKIVQNILFIIGGIILTCIVFIPLVYIIVNNLQIYVMELLMLLVTFLGLIPVMFLLLFLFQYVYIPVLTLIFGDKIDFTIKRLFYSAIILSIFLACLMQIFFRPYLSLC